ncbi:hypothetical protein KJ966_24310 [bacterium]|nr:hypothetical protein [bacterium]
MKEGFFPNANKITKFQNSDNYWIFKTGELIYKVKKKEETTSAVPLEEMFCIEICKQLLKHSPSLDAKIFTVKEINGSFTVDWDNTVLKEALYYGLSMKQLPSRGFLSDIIEKKKLTETILDRIAQRLYQFHSNAEISKSKDDGSPDVLSSKIQDLFYQSKKFLNTTINKATIDMTLRPLEKFLVENRKLFLRRLKREQIRLIHGCFVPRKIHLTNEEINFLGRTTDPLKNQYHDVASDLADLTVMLIHAKQDQLASYFVNSYCQLSGDKETGQVLPVYQAIKCLELGLKNSIKSKQSDNLLSQKQKELATQYYKHTIDVVRSL